MRRHCNGQNITLLTSLRTKTPMGGHVLVNTDGEDSDSKYDPCNCGRIFDDAHYSIIYPHVAIGSRARLQRSGKPGWSTQRL